VKFNTYKLIIFDNNFIISIFLIILCLDKKMVKSKPSLINILILLFIVQLVFSLWPVLVKIALKNGIDALLLVMLRDLIASMLLLVLSAIEDRHIFNNFTHTFINFDLQEKKIFIILGIASAINSIGYVLALHYVSPFNSSLLHPTIPVFAAFLGAILGVEKFTIRKLLGAAICICGSFLVVLSQANVNVSYSLLGNMLLVLQCIAMSVLLVGQKFVNNKHTSLKTTAQYYTLGTMFSAPICLGILMYMQSFKELNIRTWFIIGFGAFFVISFNYAGLTWATKYSSPAVSASSMMLQPPLTYILGYILEGNQVTGYRLGLEIGGGLIIFVGLVLTVLPSSTVKEAKRGLGIKHTFDFVGLFKQLIEKNDNDDQMIILNDDIEDIHDDYFDDDDDNDDDDDDNDDNDDKDEDVDIEYFDSEINKYNEKKSLLGSKDIRKIYNNSPTDLNIGGGLIRKKSSRSTSPANINE